MRQDFENWNDWSAFEKAGMKDLTDKEKLQIINIGQQINVLNGLTPNSTFGQDLIIRTIKNSYIDKSSDRIAILKSRTLGGKQLLDGGKETPLEKIKRKRR